MSRNKTRTEEPTQAQREGQAARARRDKRKTARADSIAAEERSAAARRAEAEAVLDEADRLVTAACVRTAKVRASTEEQGSLDLIEGTRNALRDIGAAKDAEIIRLRKLLITSRREVRAVTAQRTDVVVKLRLATKALRKLNKQGKLAVSVRDIVTGKAFVTNEPAESVQGSCGTSKPLVSGPCPRGVDAKGNPTFA